MARSNGMAALEREFEQTVQRPANGNVVNPSPLPFSSSSTSISPETPAAIRKLFSFHKQMTRPRPSTANLNFSPAVSPTSPSLFERRSTVVDPGMIAKLGLAKPSSSFLRGSPFDTARQESSRSKLEALGVRAAPPASTEVVNMESSVNRSTAMLLLSSLRESLDRNSSPTKVSPSKGLALGTGGLPMMARTPPRSSTRFGGRAPTTYVSPPSSYHKDGAAATVPDVDSPHADSRVLQPNMREVETVGGEEEEDNISQSLDSVTRSALDMLARLRATNTIPLEDPSGSGRVIPLKSPSFSYLGEEGSSRVGSTRLGDSRVIGSLARSFIHGNGNSTPEKTPPRPDFDRANSALRKMHSAAENVASSASAREQVPQPASTMEDDLGAAIGGGLASIHVSRRGSMHISLNPVSTEVETSSKDADGK